MTPILVAAIVLMILALTCYSIGVWSEKLAGTLKSWHLAFFWLGFMFDTVGTTLMDQIAGGFSINIHSVLGALAIILMLVHALWATMILVRKDRESAKEFHKFSIFVWLIWLVPFFVGLFIAI